MSFAAILLLALGLAMDATAVAAARGLATSRITARHLLLVALWFGGFQALMPFLGWLIGSRLGPFVQAWDHWLAFVLLAALGGRMLWEAAAGARRAAAKPTAGAGAGQLTAGVGGGASRSPAETAADPFAPRVMLLLAIATSIDALAAGITLPLLGAPLPLSLLTIGLTTALLAALGLLAGRRFGKLLGSRLDAIGGLVLIGLGTKILLEHLSAV